MKQITVKTGERWERQVMHGRIVGVVRVPVVELWYGGVRFTTDCGTDEDARVLALSLAKELVE